MDWNEKIGCVVVFTGNIKMLNEETPGILKSIYGDFCVIVYPQNEAYEYTEDGGWKPKKGSPNQIYSHGCKLTEIKLI